VGFGGGVAGLWLEKIDVLCCAAVCSRSGGGWGGDRKDGPLFTFAAYSSSRSFSFRGGAIPFSSPTPFFS